MSEKIIKVTEMDFAKVARSSQMGGYRVRYVFGYFLEVGVYARTDAYRDDIKIEKIVFGYTLFQSRIVLEPSSRTPIRDRNGNKKYYLVFNAGGI